MTTVIISTNAKEVAQDLKANERQLRLVMDRTMREIGKKAKQDFDRVTNTWDHPVNIDVEVESRGGNFEVMVGTDDRIFTMLEHGTRPHYIFPRKAKALRFWSQFRPKTTPGGLQSGHGGVSGSPVFRAWVLHPGTKPRRWIPKIQQRLNRYAPRMIENAIRRALR